MDKGRIIILCILFICLYVQSVSHCFLCGRTRLWRVAAKLHARVDLKLITSELSCSADADLPLQWAGTYPDSVHRYGFLFPLYRPILARIAVGGELYFEMIRRGHFDPGPARVNYNPRPFRRGMASSFGLGSVYYYYRCYYRYYYRYFYYYYYRYFCRYYYRCSYRYF
jgi:hypothetical protein